MQGFFFEFGAYLWHLAFGYANHEGIPVVDNIVNIGQLDKLKVIKQADHGVYLDGGDDGERSGPLGASPDDPNPALNHLRSPRNAARTGRRHVICDDRIAPDSDRN